MSLPVGTEHRTAPAHTPARARLEPRTLVELLRHVSTEHADRIAFSVKHGERWHDVPWSEQVAAVHRIARALVASGVGRGDRVALLGRTRLEWVQCDSAIVQLGAVTVGIYPSNVAADCGYILRHSGATLAFVEDREQLEKVRAVHHELPDLREVVLFEGVADAGEGVVTLEEFLARGTDADEERLARLALEVGPEDVASLVYTSGTTGVPKGAMITHANLIFSARAGAEVLSVTPGSCTLLFLPLAHVFARLIVYMCQYATVAVALVEEIGRVPEALREVRPHFIAAVPRVYEKMYERAQAAGDEAGPVGRWLFRAAVAIGRRAARTRLSGAPVPSWLSACHAVADRLVLSRVREAFGGRLEWAVSGAAALSVPVNEFFHTCGVPVLEGLGMTENASLSNVNRLERNKLGTVGPTVPGVEMKLAPDGEVLFRGPNLMRGYFRDPAATAEAIDAEGWLHSGDIGEIDGDGYLTITDRKKDLLVTAGGKNVAPQRIERTLRLSPYILQAVAFGDARKYITALVALEPARIERWAEQHGLGGKTVAELATEPGVLELIEAEIAVRNRELASFETVKRFRILPRELTVSDGDLTPTLKIRRKAVYAKYRDLVESMYGA